MNILLQTPRLVLRRFTESDADNLFALDSDSEVMRYLSGGAPTPRATIESDILPRFTRHDERTPGLGFWAAETQSDGEFIGWFCLRPSSDAPDEAILGYRLRRAVWGQGYATEGARALLRVAFAELGLRRVVATTYQDNLASRRVLEKLGMRLVRRFRVTPEDLAAIDTFHAGAAELWEGDDLEYALERHEGPSEDQTCHGQP